MKHEHSRAPGYGEMILRFTTFVSSSSSETSVASARSAWIFSGDCISVPWSLADGDDLVTPRRQGVEPIGAVADCRHVEHHIVGLAWRLAEHYDDTLILLTINENFLRTWTLDPVSRLATRPRTTSMPVTGSPGVN